MKYYESDLRNYIEKDFYNIEWNKKLKILMHIAEGLKHLHKQKIIHRDLHSRNILCKNENEVIISDLGISKSAMESTDDSKIFGIISYMAPEILQKKHYTTASDIYSFGMIMWELMTGKMPFWDQKNDNLGVEICKGFRPRPLVVINAPMGYIKLMQECWDSNPNKRPTATNISKRLQDMRNEEVKYPTEIIKLPDMPINNPETICKSRAFSITSSNFSKTSN